jgi:hypothetical protein
MSALTETALYMAWGGSLGGALVAASVLVARDQKASHRVVDLICIAFHVAIFIGLWPLVWGDA